jgi:two-component system, chemotaxis family, chemotaxis protein CheY
VATMKSMNKTILIVDDEPFIRNYFKIFISRYFPDLKIYEASDGDSAWDIAHEHHIDVATIDINMPFVNGIELIKKFKQDPDLKNTPVIVVSAHGASNIIADLKALNITDVIPKLDITTASPNNNPLVNALNKILN